MISWTLVLLLLINNGAASQSTLVKMPLLANVLPCTDTAANCAAFYYNTQTADQVALDTTVSSAKDLSASATTLLANVRTLTQQATALQDEVDPDNSRTNGGQIQQLATGRSLVGITPFMGTLSTHMVASASQRVSDFTDLVVDLNEGLASLSRVLANIQSQMNAAITASSLVTQGQISTLSSNLQDYFRQSDSKLRVSAAKFDTAQTVAPNATMQAMQNSLGLVNSAYNSTLSQLAAFNSVLTNLPSDLASYLQNTLAAVGTYESNEELFATQLSSNKSSAFTQQVLAETTQLVAQIRAVTDPSYGASLTAALAKSMADTNATEQAKLSDVNSTIVNLAGNVALSYAPAVSNLSTAAIQQTDKQFNSDTTDAILDANTTATQAWQGFTAFTANMESVWNTTSQILSGQGGAITADLLNQIGSLLSQAGVEATRLKGLMSQASGDTAEADQARQAILANSRTGVISMIGNNAAVLNSSMATIRAFLNQSSDEVSGLLKVVQTYSNDQVANINASSMTAVSGVLSQINTVQAGTQSMLASLVGNVSGLIQTDFTAMNSTFGALQATTNSYANQTGNLISSMQADNRAQFGTIYSNVNASKTSLDSVLGVSAALTNSVANISTEAAANGAEITAALAQEWATANSNLNDMSASTSSQFAAVKQLVDQAAGNFGSNQYSLISTLTGAINNATANYSQAAGKSSLSLESLMNLLNANNTLYLDQLATMDSELTTQTSSIDSTTNGTEVELASLVRNASISAATTVRDLETNASMTVNTALASIRNATIVNTNLLVQKNTASVSALEGATASLSQRIQQLKSSQPATITSNAAALKTQFSSQLTNLKNSISTLANDPSSDQTAVTATPSSLPQLEKDITTANNSANAYIRDGIGKIRSLVASALSALPIGNSTSLQNATQTAVGNSVTELLNYMNTSFSKFQNTLSQAMVYVPSDLGAQIGALQNDVVATGNALTNNTAAGSLNSLISNFGNAVTSNLTGLNGDQAVAAAQAASQNGAQVTANIALNSSNNISTGLDLLGSTLNVALASAGNVAPVSSSQLGNVSSVATSTVQITASDVAAIVAKYGSDSGAMQASIQAQLAAQGQAEMSVSAAMDIVSNLTRTADQLNQDGMDNLSDLSYSVFNDTDVLVGQVSNNQTADAVKSSVANMQATVGIFHDSNMDIVSSVESELGNLIGNVSQTQTGFNQSLASLRGYVSNLAGQLNNRYNAIITQSSQFRNLVATSAANDITEITSLVA